MGLSKLKSLRVWIRGLGHHPGRAEKAPERLQDARSWKGK